MLSRENEQTAREGSRHASASHGTATTTQFSTRPHTSAVLVEGPTQIHQRGEELCNPSAAGSAQAPTHTRGQVCQGAADRSLCMEWTPCMLEQCTRPPGLAPMHESPCFTYSHRCACLVLAGAEQWQLVIIFRRSHQLQLIGSSSSAHWPTVCSLFHAEAACESRERLVRCRPLSACAARTGRGRCLRRS